MKAEKKSVSHGKAGQLDEFEQMRAWREWRKWCSFNRVLEPFPTDKELAAGLRDELTPELRRVYYDFFRAKIARSLQKMEMEFLFPEMEQLVMDLDAYMRSKKKRISNDDAGFAAGGNYKDFVFFKAEQSADDPLKVLNGKVLSPRKGYLKIIALEVARKNHLLGNFEVKTLSLDRNVGSDGDSGRSMFEIIADSETAELAHNAAIELDGVNQFVDSLSKAEMVLLLAQSTKPKIATTELIVEKAAGVKKSVLSTRKGLLYEKIRRNAAFLCNVKMLRLLIFGIFKRLETEKDAGPFLQEVEKRFQAEQRSSDYVDD